MAISKLLKTQIVSMIFYDTPWTVCYNSCKRLRIVELTVSYEIKIDKTA